MFQVTVEPTTETAIELVKHDGGRSETGWKGGASDCVVRAIAIAEGKPYIEIYDDIAKLMKRKTGTASARNGVYDVIWKRYIKRLGYKRVDTFTPGKPKMKMRTEDMPEGKTIICEMRRHLATVIDRKLHDTYDCSEGGERRVLGYWYKA